MRPGFTIMLSLAIACSDPAPSTSPVAPESRVAAPPSAPPRAGAPSTTSSGALASEPTLRLHPIPPEVLAVVRGDLVASRPLAAAELRTEANRLIWVLDVESQSYEAWTRARSAAGRPVGRHALFEECMYDGVSEQEPPDDCPNVEGGEPADSRVRLSRISWPAGGVPSLDRREVLAGEAWAGRFREILDRDGDGRAEVGIQVRSGHDWEFGADGEQRFEWYDGDTLHRQLTIERSSFVSACTGGQEERAGFSFRDRNSDGHDDVGVRHAVWSDFEGECETREDGWPDPSSCSVTEERLRFFYDVASDEWRVPDGGNRMEPTPFRDPLEAEDEGE